MCEVEAGWKEGGYALPSASRMARLEIHVAAPDPRDRCICPRPPLLLHCCASSRRECVQAWRRRDQRDTHAPGPGDHRARQLWLPRRRDALAQLRSLPGAERPPPLPARHATAGRRAPSLSGSGRMERQRDVTVEHAALGARLRRAELRPARPGAQIQARVARMARL
jgi:hypothetical protein